MLFNKMTSEERLKVIDNRERGKEQPDEVIHKVMDISSKANDDLFA